MISKELEQVSNYILHHFNQKNESITQLKLQALVYFAQVWYLAFYKEPLFPDVFQAWIGGPTIPELREKFAAYHCEPIDYPVMPPVFEDATISEHLEEVLRHYGDEEGSDLRSRCCKDAHHTMLNPYKNARRGLAIDDSCENEISHRDMRHFYSILGSSDRKNPVTFQELTDAVEEARYTHHILTTKVTEDWPSYTKLRDDHNEARERLMIMCKRVADGELEAAGCKGEYPNE
jgi:uncharacterized phage-associated protein